MTRGGFSITAAGAALAALLAGPGGAEGSGKRTVVLTGASSGIGLDAASKLVRETERNRYFFWHAQGVVAPLLCFGRERLAACSPSSGPI